LVVVSIGQFVQWPAEGKRAVRGDRDRDRERKRGGVRERSACDVSIFWDLINSGKGGA
jgi:hypothetical protein